MSDSVENKAQPKTNDPIVEGTKREEILTVAQKNLRRKRLTKTKQKLKNEEPPEEVKELSKETVKIPSRQVKKKDAAMQAEEKNTSSEKIEESGDKLKTKEDFEQLSEVANILKEIEGNSDKVCLTKSEKKCLEDITKFATKVRAPLDERQMMFYNKDCEKFSAAIGLKETELQNEREVREAAIVTNESPSKVMTTELNTLVSYLVNLKSLIATREIAWATTTDNDYAQKAEIKRLKTEVENLRVVCTKRQSELKEKDQIIVSKEQELVRWQKIVQKLKMRLIVLEKESSGIEDDTAFEEPAAVSLQARPKNRMTPGGEPIRKTRLQLVEDAILAEARNRRGLPNVRLQGREQSGIEIRKNQGPAAMLANALYNARNEGNFVQF